MLADDARRRVAGHDAAPAGRARRHRRCLQRAVPRPLPARRATPGSRSSARSRRSSRWSSAPRRAAPTSFAWSRRRTSSIRRRRAFALSGWTERAPRPGAGRSPGRRRAGPSSEQGRPYRLVEPGDVEHEGVLLLGRFDHQLAAAEALQDPERQAPGRQADAGADVEDAAGRRHGDLVRARAQRPRPAKNRARRTGSSRSGCGPRAPGDRARPRRRSCGPVCARSQRCWRGAARSGARRAGRAAHPRPRACCARRGRSGRLGRFPAGARRSARRPCASSA